MFSKNKRPCQPLALCQHLQYNPALLAILVHRQNVMKSEWPVDPDDPDFTAWIYKYHVCEFG